MEVSGASSVPAGLQPAAAKSVADVEKEMRRLLTPRAPLITLPPPTVPFMGMQPFNPLAPAIVPGMMAIPGAVPGVAVPVPIPTTTMAAAGAPTADQLADPLEGRNVDPAKAEEIRRTL